MSATSRTKLMILSDTHNIESLAARDSSCQPLPKVDVLLHCGDLTQVGGLSAYKKALDFLGSFDAELKLAIAGNHDISLDQEYWLSHLEEDDDPDEHQNAIDLMTGPLAKAAGVTYLSEGTHVFGLSNGAHFTLYASPYQPECGGWAFGYSSRTQDRFNATPAPGLRSIGQRPIPSNVDIIMTHGPPRGILDLVPHNKEHAGCDALLQAVRCVRPLLHCFGHIHEGYGVDVRTWETGEIEQYPSQLITVAQAGRDESGQFFTVEMRKDTLMVNAAIMDGQNNATNLPWLVELELPVKGGATAS